MRCAQLRGAPFRACAQELRSVRAVFLPQALEDSHDVRTPVLHCAHVLLGKLTNGLAVHFLHGSLTHTNEHTRRPGIEVSAGWGQQ